MELDDDGCFNYDQLNPAPTVSIERLLSWCIFASCKWEYDLESLLRTYARKKSVIPEDHWLL